MEFVFGILLLLFWFVFSLTTDSPQRLFPSSILTVSCQFDSLDGISPGRSGRRATSHGHDGPAVGYGRGNEGRRDGATSGPSAISKGIDETKGSWS